MKDRIGNTLAVGDRVLVSLPESAILGYVAEVKETGLLARVRGGGADTAPGHVMVSCVIALPVESLMDAVPQVMKVCDPAKPSEASKGVVDASKPN